MVWTIFCIPLNEYGFALLPTSRRIIGIPRRGTHARDCLRFRIELRTVLVLQGMPNHRAGLVVLDFDGVWPVYAAVVGPADITQLGRSLGAATIQNRLLPPPPQPVGRFLCTPKQSDKQVRG